MSLSEEFVLKFRVVRDTQTPFRATAGVPKFPDEFPLWVSASIGETWVLRVGSGKKVLEFFTPGSFRDRHKIRSS
jgi:hypothetical protein